MEQKQFISLHQLTVLVILTTIGDAILVLPAIVANSAHQDAWLSTIIGLIFGMLIIWLLIKSGSLYPKLTLIQSIIKIFGKWIGLFVSIFFICYLFLSAAAHTSELGNFITTQILIDTPTQVIYFMFVFVIILGVRLGFQTIARTSEVLYLFVFTFLIILFTFVLPSVNIDWIRPILADGIKPVIKGSIVATAFPFMELIVFLMFVPNFKNEKHFKKGMLVGALIGGLILVIVVLLCILVLGESTTTRNLYPTFALARSISIGHTIQRIEGIIAILWTITVYLKITLYTYAFHLGIMQLFKLSDYRFLTLPTGLILFATTILISPNISYFNNMIANYWPFYDATVAILIPLALIGVFTVRKKLNTS